MAGQLVSMNNDINDQVFMAEALRLAEKGLYTTRSNPRVGCVVVKDKEIIGRGFHLSPGGSHAEVLALNSTPNSANSTVYVTLEPCSHQGKTPPCVNALVDAKVSRVVAAMKDPNPVVNGKGLAYLNNHDIETAINILETDALELNKGFVKRMEESRPYITVKSAISLDGKTALKSGESKWISCTESRQDVQKLRARSCVVMTGIDTIMNDDPHLTVRLNSNELNIEGELQQPKRVILDTHLRISPKANILNQAEDVIIYTCVDKNKISDELNNSNAEIITTKLTNNHVDLIDVMKDLAEREFNEVLVEAGSTLVGSLLEDKLVDELIVYLAPHIMGDASYGLARLHSIKTMKDRVKLEICQTRKIGSDIKLQLKPKYNQ